jgi:TPR repeat protein
LEGAAYYFKLAADQSDPNATYYHSVSLLRSEGVPGNLLQAVNAMKRAADGGVPDAQNGYACFLESDIGVQTNLGAAAAFYKLSGAARNSQGMSELGLCLDLGKG